MFKRTQLMSSFSVPSLFFDEAVDYIRSRVIDADMFIDKTIHIDELAKYLKPNYNSSKLMKITVKLDKVTP